MQTNHHAFPWGVYLGDLNNENDSLPVFLPSQAGGFTVLFDNDSEATTNNFIENIALKLFDVLPVGEICVDVFDFSHRSRFMHLADLRAESLYRIALTENEATNLFNELEKTALYRHHQLLSFKTPTLSQFNQQNTVTEKYHLLLINLTHYPDDLASFKRIKEFFDSAFEAGFYCIAFAHQKVLDSDSKATQYLLQRFPTLEVIAKKIQLNNKLFEFSKLAKDYSFEYVNDNKDLIIEKLKHSLHAEDDNKKEFLSILIGKSMDGRQEIHFTLGEKSKNYHAFITGTIGTGKTTLINNFIINISKKYTAKEIRLYLMDYKDGVEFNVFNNHPNCEKIFLDNKDFNAAIHLLHEFTATISDRNAIFIANDVKDINSYNKAHPESIMPRLILIIDECQRLFSNTNFRENENFISLLTDVTKRGRSVGLHIILLTQNADSIPSNTELMSEIPLRISFRLNKETFSEKIFSFGNTAAFNLPDYVLIYNARAGEKTANVLCRANPEIERETIKTTIDTIIATRKTDEIISPVIVRSVTEDKPTVEPTSRKEEKISTLTPSKNYDTEDATELLKLFISTQDLQPPRTAEGFFNEGEK